MKQQLMYFKVFIFLGLGILAICLSRTGLAVDGNPPISNDHLPSSHLQAHWRSGLWTTAAYTKATGSAKPGQELAYSLSQLTNRR